MTKLEKQKELDRIASEIANDCPCPLKGSATNAVPGEGNADAKLFFIGEAPGEKEDQQGRPFVGAAGRVLEQLLESIGLKRADVFIANVCKFRPPGNRDPEPEEILACFPYLERQIKTIDPKLIITLGRHSLRRMFEWEKGEPILETISIGALHGKPFRGKSVRIYYPVYHPAAALHNPNLKATLVADFARIPKVIDKI